jgi:hypothetical protein
VIPSEPFYVYPIDRSDSIAAFKLRIDAFDFARKETLPSKRGDTGYPFMCVERRTAGNREMHIFHKGVLVDKHGTVIE